MSVSVPPRRADARRNYDRILRAAEVEVADHGAEASLEEIARRAGVGSATLHRHFPSRRELLQAVFHDRVEALCARGRLLTETDEAHSALREWLTDLTVFGATTRGMARSLVLDPNQSAPSSDGSCETMLATVGGALLAKAQRTGAVRGDISILDLLMLVNAVSLVTEGSTDAADAARRLLNLALEGIRFPEA
ncbi:TetR/AcrR family transcriptional regulator [Catenuloplanes atrovinosus]|uniref:AcrR family transcriptional regulator n=1 Tax=Catenuloplanes atrovinosus TaxID=137266 RepID=A0AAE3YQ39_9ACTN|nr:helix-turn-helix domain-containing protein [Catenuloplanes atrovinosus]MDR7277207.1 AcrR family transcriptional regulator [Catenuloplanes atrovinosus]